MTLMDAVCVEAVETALRLGYRHIDTAERYRNEIEVGEGLRGGLRAAGLAREDVFVTTKVFHDWLAAADFERSLDQSLRNLELSWVDLLLIHWPNPNVPLKETLDVLCKARRDGRAKHVGVANFTASCSNDVVKFATPTCFARPSRLALHRTSSVSLSGTFGFGQWMSRRSTQESSRFLKLWSSERSKSAAASQSWKTLVVTKTSSRARPAARSPPRSPSPTSISLR